MLSLATSAFAEGPCDGKHIVVANHTKDDLLISYVFSIKHDLATFHQGDKLAAGKTYKGELINGMLGKIGGTVIFQSEADPHQIVVLKYNFNNSNGFWGFGSHCHAKLPDIDITPPYRYMGISELMDDNIHLNLITLDS